MKFKKTTSLLEAIILLMSISVISPNIDNDKVLAQIPSPAPNLQFKWINDGGGDLNDGELPTIPSNESAPINIQFQIIGKDHSYFGNGGDIAQKEASENITINGNALFTGTLDKIPGVSFATGTWTVPIIPTMNPGGGHLDIYVKWKGYGSLKEILAIGGTNYIRNGTIVEVTPKEFEIGTDQTFTVQVKYSDGSTINSANAYLYFIDDGESNHETATGAGDPIQGHLIYSDTYGFDGYSLVFNKTQQRKNQTEAGFGTIKAPRNLTVFARAYVGGTPVYGWALIRMKPCSDLKVTFEAIDSPATSTLLAGYNYSYFYINITKVDETGNDSGIPNEDDYTHIKVKILNAQGDDVTTSIGSITASDLAAINMGKDYVYELSNECITKHGIFTIYVRNHTSDSTGNSGTIDVKQAHVECDKSPFIWAYDNNISANFTVTSEITGGRLNGTLRIENISRIDKLYNMTWTNTSNLGNFTIDLDESDGFINGQIKVNDITASYLPPGEAIAYITYWFKPELSDGSSGEWARASGISAVSVGEIAAYPEEIPFNEPATIEITSTGRDQPLEGRFISIEIPGIPEGYSDITNPQGKVIFSFIPVITGTIKIKVENRTTDTTIKIVTNVTDHSPEPPIINGPTSGRPDKKYSYIFVSEDPDGDDVYYEILWGDGTYNPWFGPFCSNEVIIVNHSWSQKGTFTIMARARDINGSIGDWGTLEVAISRDKSISNLLQRFYENHQFLYNLLQLILQRFG